jgi:cell division protein FtsL
MRSLIFLCLALVTISAMVVVYVRHHHRLSYVALQQAQQSRDDLNIEWGQLLLEQSTWAIHNRVETEANRKLGMVAPEPDRIVVIGVQ